MLSKGETHSLRDRHGIGALAACLLSLALSLFPRPAAADPPRILRVPPAVRAWPIVRDLVFHRPVPMGPRPAPSPGPFRRRYRPTIREVYVTGLPDAGMTEMTRSGPLILYNPALLRAAGPAGEFVRAHERAHVILEHLDIPRLLGTLEGRAEAEAEADCFAAREVSPHATLAMVRLLLRRPPEPRDVIYGTKPERARRILACAGIQAG